MIDEEDMQFGDEDAQSKVKEMMQA